jgi:hypothetical protein
MAARQDPDGLKARVQGAQLTFLAYLIGIAVEGVQEEKSRGTDREPSIRAIDARSAAHGAVDGARFKRAHDGRRDAWSREVRLPLPPRCKTGSRGSRDCPRRGRRATA